MTQEFGILPNLAILNPTSPKWLPDKNYNAIDRLAQLIGLHCDAFKHAFESSA